MAQRRAQHASKEETILPESDRRSREAPSSPRAKATYERIMATAAALLEEVGFDDLTTNAICARAGLTPPALYRYFGDKYAILEELAVRLLRRQYEAYAVWLFEAGQWKDDRDRVTKLAAWFRQSAEIVASTPGGVSLLRALRSLPALAHVRESSIKVFTERMFDYYRHVFPGVPEAVLRHRLRLRAEFGFAIDEMALNNADLDPDVLFREAAYVVGHVYDPALAPVT